MEDGERITIAQASKIIPGSPCVATVWRWCRHGIKDRDGNQIKLASIRAGHRYFTTRADINAFFDLLSEKYEDDRAPDEMGEEL